MYKELHCSNIPCSSKVSCDKEQPKNLYVAITSDRGLAGGVHSNICKAIRADIHEMTPEAAANTKVICVGDKSRAFMARYFPKNLILVGSEIGRLPPQVVMKLTVTIFQMFFRFPVRRRCSCGQCYLEQWCRVRSGEDDVQQIQVCGVLRYHCHPTFLPR